MPCPSHAGAAQVLVNGGLLAGLLCVVADAAGGWLSCNADTVYRTADTLQYSQAGPLGSRQQRQAQLRQQVLSAIVMDCRAPARARRGG